MAPSDFANADIDAVVANLTTQEAILLTAGEGFWHTQEIKRLGIPAVKVRAINIILSTYSHQAITDDILLITLQVSDGPNGIRGNHFFMGTPAKCLPVCAVVSFSHKLADHGIMP